MSAFMKAARFVGDLDDEFYADELQRDIWNEASAVGFQSLLWIGLIAGSILPFVGGVTGAWVALGIYIALVSVACVVLGYARVRGVDMYTSQELVRVRIAVASALLMISGCGSLLRLLVHYGGGNLHGVWFGVAIGGSIGLAAGVVGIMNHRRRKRNAELAEEKAELQGFQAEG